MEHEANPALQEMTDLMSGMPFTHLSFICNMIVPDKCLDISSTIHQKILTPNNKLYIQSGSSAEGSAVPPTVSIQQTDGHICFTDVKRADIDLLCHFLPAYKVEITTDESPPGYCRLVELKTRDYFLPIGYVQRDASDTHGPARTLEVADLSIDFVPAFVIDSWPTVAAEWYLRDRTAGWPTVKTLIEVVNAGYHIVAAENQTRQNEYSRYIDWRLSFSAAENILVQSWNIIQRKCYVLLKMIKRVRLAECTFVKSYHLKNIVLWDCEGIPIDRWSRDEIGGRMPNLLDKLLLYLAKGTLPHYFIPQNNLFINVQREDLKIALRKVSQIRKDFISPLLEFTDSQTFLGGIISNTYRKLLAPILGGTRQGLVREEALGDVARDVVCALLEDIPIWAQFAASRAPEEDRGEILLLVKDSLREFFQSETESLTVDILLGPGRSHVSDFIGSLFEDLTTMPDGAADKFDEPLHWESPGAEMFRREEVAADKMQFFVGYDFLDAIISLISPVMSCWEILKYSEQFSSRNHDIFNDFSKIIPVISDVMSTFYYQKAVSSRNRTDAIKECAEKLGQLVKEEQNKSFFSKSLERLIKQVFDQQVVHFQSVQGSGNLDDARELFSHWAVQPKFIPCLKSITEQKILGPDAYIIGQLYLESLNEFTGRREERLFLYMRKVCELLSPWDAIASYLYLYAAHSGVVDSPCLLFNLMKSLYGCSPSINTAAIGILTVVGQYWPQYSTLGFVRTPVLFIISRIQESDVWKKMLSSGVLRSQATEAIHSVLQWESKDILNHVYPVILSEKSSLCGTFLLALQENEKLHTIFQSWQNDGNSDQCVDIFCKSMNDLFQAFTRKKEYRWSNCERNDPLTYMRYILAFFLFSMFPAIRPEEALTKVVRIFIDERMIPETLSYWHIIAGVLQYRLDPSADSFRTCLKSKDLIIPGSILYSRGFYDMLGSSKLIPLFYELEFQFGLLDIRKGLRELLISKYPDDPEALSKVLMEAYQAKNIPPFEITFDSLVAIMTSYREIMAHRIDKTAHVSFSFPHGTSVHGRQLTAVLVRLYRDIGYIPQLHKLICQETDQDATLQPSTFFNSVSGTESGEKLIKLINANSEVYKLCGLPDKAKSKEELILQFLRNSSEGFKLTHIHCNLCFELLDALVEFKHLYQSLKEGVFMIFNALLPGCHPYSQAKIYLLQNEDKYPDVQSLPGLMHFLREKLQWLENDEDERSNGEAFSEFIIECFPDQSPLWSLRQILVERNSKGKMLLIKREPTFRKQLDRLLGEVYPLMTRDEAAASLVHSLNKRLEQKGQDTLYMTAGNEFQGLVLMLSRVENLMYWHRIEYDHFQLYLWRRYPGAVLHVDKSLSLMEQMTHVIRRFIDEAFTITEPEDYNSSLCLLLHELFPTVLPDEGTYLLVSGLEKYFGVKSEGEIYPSFLELVSHLQNT